MALVVGSVVPSVRSRLKVTDRFYPPCSSALEFSTQTTAAAFGASITATDSSPLLAHSSHQFHSILKTFLFEQSFPP